MQYFFMVKGKSSGKEGSRIQTPFIWKMLYPTLSFTFILSKNLFHIANSTWGYLFPHKKTLNNSYEDDLGTEAPPLQR